MTTSTISAGMRQSQPLFGNRAQPQRSDQGPQDQVSLGAHDPALAPHETHFLGGFKSLAAGALALGSLVGGLAMAAPAMAQEVQTPQTETATNTVERHQTPVSADQQGHLQDLGQQRDGDNSTARQLRGQYRQLGDRLVSASNAFVTQTHNLEQLGQRLEAQAQNLGPGLHTTFVGSINVEQSEAGETVTQQFNGSSKQVRHYGDSVVVETNDGHGHVQRLEDTPDSRSFTQGTTTSTLYLTDSVLHSAGSFEIQDATRSYQETLSVSGTSISHGMERTIPQQTTHELFQEPRDATGGVQLTYHKDVQKGPSAMATSSSTQDVELRADGSTRTVTPDGEQIEPAAQPPGADAPQS